MTSSRGKLSIWFIILALLIGCVPAIPKPTAIPPLDSNAIDLMIGQTADAASIQTLAAMPPSTPTATFTPTPRNTFTPEPSLTPISTFVIPSSTPVVNILYYRVKHDNQMADQGYKSRAYDGNSEGVRDQTPETVPLFVIPKLGSGTLRTKVDGPWETYIDALNNYDEGKLRYLKSDGTALFNTAGFPQLQSLTMGGNIIRLDLVQNGWGRVVTMDYGSPPSAEEVNYFTRPDLVHKFVVTGWKRSTKTTILVNPPKGDIYWPLVTKRTVWIQMDRVEPFPILPMDVTVKKDLYIQTDPGPKIEQTKFQLLTGQSATIVKYYPTGPNVWGMLQNGGWIPLLLYSTYYTSWSMATIPPP